MSEECDMLAARLVVRTEIERAAREAQHDPEVLRRLWRLLDADSHTVAWHAAWAMDKATAIDPAPMVEYRPLIEARAMAESRSGIQRLLLSIVNRMPQAEPISVDMLDFCLEEIARPRLSIASRALCCKIAFGLCRGHVELRDELRACLESIDEQCLSTAVAAAVRNTLKKLNKKMR